jgi:hypothetical protein
VILWLAVAFMVVGVWTPAVSKLGLMLLSAALFCLLVGETWPVNIAIVGAVVGIRLEAVREAVAASQGD